MMSKPDLKRIKLIKKPGVFEFKSEFKAEVVAITDTIILRIKADSENEQINGQLVEAEFISKSGLSVGDILHFDAEGVAIEQESSDKRAKQIKPAGQGCSRAPVNM